MSRAPSSTPSATRAPTSAPRPAPRLRACGARYGASRAGSTAAVARARRAGRVPARRHGRGGALPHNAKSLGARAGAPDPDEGAGRPLAAVLHRRRGRHRRRDRREDRHPRRPDPRAQPERAPDRALHRRENPSRVRRLALLCLVTMCHLAGSAAAAGSPQPDARAWLVENPATGEVLARQDATAELPIASLTKLMTVLVALDHHR